MQTLLLFRKQTPHRKSIENVFLPLASASGVSRQELPCDLKSPLDAIRLLWFSLKLKGSIIHITGDVHYMATYLFWKKTILTIHDCNHYEGLKGLRKYLMGLIWYKLPLMSATRITVISPFTRDQLMTHFKVAPGKIEVIPNSFLPVKKQDKPTRSSGKATILAIGSLPLKNHDRLVEAVKDMADLKLLFIGRLSQGLIDKLNAYGIEYESRFDVSRLELEACYNAADMLFFASTQEGFGLPILEAQSCGLPVITSNISSMPWVAGKGALLVDPLNIIDIRKAILQIQYDENSRKSLIEEGILNTARFSEQVFIQSYLNEYKLLGKKA